MRIYLIHSSGMDFKEELYDPIKKSDLWPEHEFDLPHEDSEEPIDSRDLLKNDCDLVVAEVSEPSTGAGIEVGWADEFGVPVLCVHREGAEISGSLEKIDCEIRSYGSSDELIETIRKRIGSYSS